jgi:hypothetical protein
MHCRLFDRILLLVVALTSLAACNGDGADNTLPPPPPDPYAVPAVIDEAYVNRVLAALDQVEGDVVRHLVATRRADDYGSTRLRAIYNDPQYQLELDALMRSAKTDLSEYKTPPGNRKSAVIRLATRRSDCILAETTRDFSGVVRAPPPRRADEVDLVTLRPTQADADPKNFNPTPWSIGNAEIIKAGQTPDVRAQCPA